HGEPVEPRGRSHRVPDLVLRQAQDEVSGLMCSTSRGCSMFALRFIRLALVIFSLFILPAQAQDAPIDIPASVAALGEASLRELSRIVADLSSTGDTAVIPVLNALG